MPQKTHTKQAFSLQSGTRPNALRVAGSLLVAFLLSQISPLSLYPSRIFAASIPESSFLVNTEAFQTIDDDDTESNVELIFGNTLAESLIFDRTQSRFEFSDDLYVQDNLTSSGGLAIELNIRTKEAMTINSDNDTNDATLTFGNETLAQTLKFVHSMQKFQFSTAVDVNGSLYAHGTISGSELRANNMTVSGAIVYSSGNTLKQAAKGLSGQLLVSQGTSAPVWVQPVGGMVWYIDGALSAGTNMGAQVTMPFGIMLTDVTLNVTDAPVGSALIVDVNKNGTTIFSTRPQIDANATTGGATAVISDTIIPPNALMTLDIDQVGSTAAGSGLTVILKGYRRY